MIIFKNNWKREVISLFLLCFSNFSYSQVFIRHSDSKSFESVTIVNSNKTKILNKDNLRNYKYEIGDKVLYNTKLLDFAIDHDTLFFFDKVKEIDEVQLTADNLKNKKEKTVKSSENKRAIADIFPNNRIATLVKIDVQKKSFIKSITFYPDKRFTSKNLTGKIQIQILSNLNGFPDNNNPILIFEKDMSETSLSKWEIELPRIIKYPENGFFVTFFYETKNKATAVLRLNDDSDMYMFYPQNNEWRSIKNNGYLYKVKLLQ